MIIIQEDRKLVTKQVRSIRQNTPFTFGDLKKLNLKEDSEIHILDMENGFLLEVYVKELESVEAYIARKESLRNYEIWSRQERYREYQKLKEEFESDFKIGNKTVTQEKLRETMKIAIDYKVNSTEELRKILDGK